VTSASAPIRSQFVLDYRLYRHYLILCGRSARTETFTVETVSTEVRIGLRLASVEYLRSRLGNANGQAFNQGLRVSAGLLMNVWGVVVSLLGGPVQKINPKERIQQ
jgi:hypothetical protein